MMPHFYLNLLSLYGVQYEYRLIEDQWRFYSPKTDVTVIVTGEAMLETDYSTLLSYIIQHLGLSPINIDVSTEDLIHSEHNPCVTIPKNKYYFQDMARMLPGMQITVEHPYHPTKSITCPKVDRRKIDLMSLIIHLNDTDRWTRYEIADWLETLDNIPTFGVQ